MTPTDLLWQLGVRSVNPAHNLAFNPGASPVALARPPLGAR